MAIRQVTGLASYALPAELNREIGRVIVRWAHYESSVQTLVYSALSLSVSQGRTAVREPRIIERIDMLRDLAVLNGKKLDHASYKAIRKETEELAVLRDLIAHSIWLRYDGDWHALVTRGTWNDEVLKGTEFALSKKATPESRVVTVTLLRESCRRIERLGAAMAVMAKAAGIEPLPPERY